MENRKTGIIDYLYKYFDYLYKIIKKRKECILHGFVRELTRETRFLFLIFHCLLICFSIVQIEKTQVKGHLANKLFEKEL